MLTRSKAQKFATTNPTVAEEDSVHTNVYEKPMLSSAFKSIASVQEVVTFSKCVDQATMSRQETNESLQSNQCIVALEPSATDQSNNCIRSTYPTPIIQDPNMQIANPIVTKSSPNSVAKKITNTNDDVRTRTSSSIHSSGSRSSTSSRSSAKSKRAMLMARLQAQAEINALEEQQAKRRFDYEQKLLEQTRLREEQELKFQHQLTEAKLRAQLNETIAQMQAEEEKTDPFNNPTSSTQLIADNVSNMFRTSFVNENYAGPSINILPASVSSSMINQPTECSNKLNPIQDPVNNVAHASSADPKNRSYKNVEFNLLPPASNGAQTIKPSNCLSYSTKKEGYPLSQSCTITQDCRGPWPNECFSAKSQAYTNQSFRIVPENNDFGSTNWQSAPEIITSAPNDVTTSCNRRFNANGSVNPSGRAPDWQPAMPILEPPIFEGNPANYCSFVDSFDALISYNVPEPKRKLFYLLRYTSGSANALVKGCQYLPADQGYAEARKLLQQTYGQKFQIAKTCIDSIVNGPPLHYQDKASLVKFSAELKSCVNTLIGMNYLHKMDNIDVLNKISKCLPSAWVNGWQVEVDNVIHVRMEEVSIKHLTDYVSLRTRQCTNFANDWSQVKSRLNNPAINKRGKASFATQVNIEKKMCRMCEGPHFLNQCKHFRKLDYDARKSFVIKAKLCWSCLEPDHLSKSCPRTNPCLKQDCNGRHTTLLHPPNLSNQSTTPAERNRGEHTTAIAKVSSAFVGSDSLISGLLPVVPVKIRCTNSNEFITTLALLDNGSTSSFISESLIKALRAKNFSVINVSTATINQVQTTHKAKVINGLQISDLAQSNFFQLNPTLSINSIPVGKGDIPTQEDVNQFLEFKDVYIPLMDEEVGLLIGNDNAPVMQPLEVTNTDAGYYAIKTPVGWTINCPKKNGVYPKLNKTFLVRLNNHPMCTLCTDVVDTNINNNQLSRDQTRFLNFVSTSIRHLDNQHYEIALPVRNSEIQLPLNRTMAEQRACYLKRKFLKNPAFFEHYKTFVNDMLVNNHAERVEKA